ncbi:MAG: ChrR family anti-sigma-E factor [Pseudomonadota bacterium]
MTAHLPPEEMLADYACGAMSPGISLLVASHLSQVPESRRKVREFESIGGVLLEAEEPVEMAPSALDAVFAQIDVNEPVVPKAPVQSSGPLPAPLLDAIGYTFDEIPWKFRLPGVSTYHVEGYGNEEVMLLRGKPGAKVPQHTHEGMEATLVLQGVLMDGDTAFQPGDIAINDEQDDHRPYIGGDEVCYCLIVQQGDLKFTGTFSRILNYIGE